MNLTNLPEAAVVDYMHQVFLGCVKKSMSETDKKLVSKRLQVKVNGANRNLRVLNCVTDWK